MNKPSDILETAEHGEDTFTLERSVKGLELKVNGNLLMEEKCTMSEQMMADLVRDKLIDGARILVGGLGLGFTLKRLLHHAQSRVEIMVAEIVPELIDWHRKHLDPSILDDPRVTIHKGDVSECLDPSDQFDVILMDVDNDPDHLLLESNGKFYTQQGIEHVQRCLAMGGRVVYWAAFCCAKFEFRLGQEYRKTMTVPFKSPGHDYFLHMGIK